MNNKQNLLSIITLLSLYIISINTSFAFNVCNVDFAEGGGDFRTGSNDRVFYIDKDGDILTEGLKSTTANYNNLKW